VTICPGDADKYRFGANTQEKVNEWSGIGNHYTAEFWEYDAQTGRRLNLDPVDQISISNYAVNRLSPILFSDPNGDYSKIGASWRNALHGGQGISYTETTGEWGYDKGDDGGAVYHDGLSNIERTEKINKFKENHIRFNNQWIKTDPGTLSAYRPTATQKWAESESLLGKASYAFVDGFYVTGQNLFTKNFRSDDMAFHIGGTPTTVNENMDAFIDVGLNFVPSAEEAKYGLGYLKKLGAPQFSKLFKGTAISRAKPIIRGYLNRGLNLGITKVNEKLATGMGGAM